MLTDQQIHKVFWEGSKRAATATTDVEVVAGVRAVFAAIGQAHLLDSSPAPPSLIPTSIVVEYIEARDEYDSCLDQTCCFIGPNTVEERLMRAEARLRNAGIPFGDYGGITTGSWPVTDPGAFQFDTEES